MTHVLLLPFITTVWTPLNSTLDTCGPRNNKHYLVRVKNVYDDDDDATVPWNSLPGTVVSASYVY